MYRVIDETDEDYLYPEEEFIVVEDYVFGRNQLFDAYS